MSTQGVQTGRALLIRRWPRPAVVAICGAVALLGVAIIVLPWLMWAAQINRAGRLIEQGTSWPAARSSDTIPIASDPRRLEQARIALEAAIKWRPDDAHAFRLLGQIALAEGDWAKAETAFGEAGRRAPSNLLITWEQALAYEGRHGIGWEPADQTQASQLRQLWQRAGLSMEQFIARGDEDRYGNRPEQALRWYGRASVFAPETGIPWYYAGLVYAGQGQNERALQAYQQAIRLQPDLRVAWEALAARADSLFRQGDWAAAHEFYRQSLELPDLPADFRFRAALAGSSANAAPPGLLSSLGVPVRPVTTTTTIEGETMHWIDSDDPALADGTPIKPGYANRTLGAALWWQGAATAVVDVPQGTYTVKVRVASPPGAVAQMAIEIDGRVIDTFETLLDGAYSEHRVQVELESGSHVVAIRFLNNGVVNGVDNNAFIDWLRITR